jgi:glycosyltransferase 2 family protein
MGQPLRTEQGPTWRRVVSTGLKCLTSVGLIYWLLRGSGLDEVWNAIGSANRWFLLLALSLSLLGPYVSAQRWRVLLKAYGLEASLAFLIQSCLVGIFFNNFLPSTVGGDAMRAYDSWRLGRSKTAAVVVVILDRCLGIIVLLLFAVGALLLSEELRSRVPSGWVAIGTGGVMFVGGVIFCPRKPILAVLARLSDASRLFLRSDLSTVVTGLLDFRSRRKALAKAGLWSVILQANVVVHYYLIAEALGFGIPLFNFFLVVPLAIVVVMLPVSINGIGIRESVFAVLFSAFGIESTKAIALAWLAYGAGMLQGLVGGVVYALRR